MAPPKRRRVEAVAMPMSDEESSDDDSSLELSSDEDTDDDDPLGFNNNGNSRNGDDNNAEKSDGDGDEDEFEASSKCPVCFELLGEANIPKILKCGHTICDGCAGKMISRSLIKCPLCQASMRARRAGDLATNYALKNVIEETVKKEVEHSAERAKWDEKSQQMTSNEHENDQFAPDAFSLVICDSCKTHLTSPTETYACLDRGCTIAKEHKLSPTDADSAQSVTYILRAAKRMCTRCICRHHLSHEVVPFEQVVSEVPVHGILTSLYQKIFSRPVPDIILLNLLKKVVDEVRRSFSDGLAKLSQSDKALTNEQWDEVVKQLGDLLGRVEKFFTASMMEEIQVEVLNKFLTGGASKENADSSSNSDQ